MNNLTLVVSYQHIVHPARCTWWVLLFRHGRSFTLQEKLAFTTQKAKAHEIHVRDKLCDFIHYNVYYMTFMVMYSTQKKIAI
jgi:hypothetical protein